MTEHGSLAEELAEQQRLNAWLQTELEQQRKINAELRKAVADLARTFQAALAEAYAAGESGDIARVRAITRANQANWQQYLQQIISAAQKPPPRHTQGEAE